MNHHTTFSTERPTSNLVALAVCAVLIVWFFGWGAFSDNNPLWLVVSAVFMMPLMLAMTESKYGK